MSKFNSKKKTKRAVQKSNMAGVTAYAQGPKNELISFMLNEYNGFGKDSYYKTSDQSYDRFIHLIDQTIKVDPLFVAKLALFARGGKSLKKSLPEKYKAFAGGKLRTVSHITAARLSKAASGKDWARSFYYKIIERVDDMTEIYSYYNLVMNQKKMPNAMKAGFNKSFSKFDRYQLAKYRAAKSEVKLVDIVNLVHPVQIPKHQNALTDLHKGVLRVDSTWEAKVSSAGKKDNSKTAKTDAYNELLSENRMGGLALLRNARNVIDTGDLDTVKKYIESLKRKGNFRMILPTDILKSYDVLSNMRQTKLVKMVLDAFDEVVQHTIPNIEIEGSTAIIIDGSGSMDQSAKGDSTSFNCKQLAAFFAASLYGENPYDTEVVLFGTTAKKVRHQDLKSVFGFAKHNIGRYHVGHSTYVDAAFDLLQNKHDRVVLISDMQMTSYSPDKSLNAYKSRVGGNPKLYLWNLATYGTTPFKPQKTHIEMSGWNFDCFNIIANSEVSPNELQNVINSIKL